MTRTLAPNPRALEPPFGRYDCITFSECTSEISKWPKDTLRIRLYRPNARLLHFFSHSPVIRLQVILHTKVPEPPFGRLKCITFSTVICLKFTNYRKTRSEFGLFVYAYLFLLFNILTVYRFKNKFNIQNNYVLPYVAKKHMFKMYFTLRIVWECGSVMWKWCLE